MRVAVDHPRARRAARKRRPPRSGATSMIDSGFSALLSRLLRRSQRGDHAAHEIGQAQQARLRRRVAHARAVRLVLGVVGAQLVAVAQQRAHAVQVEHDEFGQQRGARACANRSPSMKSRLPWPTYSGTPASEMPAHRFHDVRHERHRAPGRRRPTSRRGRPACRPRRPRARVPPRTRGTRAAPPAGRATGEDRTGRGWASGDPDRHST